MRRIMTFGLRGALVLCATWGIACGGDQAIGAGDGGHTGSGETSGVPTTSSGAATDASSGSSSTTGSTGDGGEPGSEPCDLFAQECPEGEKCTLYAKEGSSYLDWSKCVPVTGDGKPGEPCTTVGGGLSGIDDCEEGAMCWDIDAENEGFCIEMCSGSAASPVCKDPDASYCHINSDGVVNLCRPYCDPLIQDCTDDALCIPLYGQFLCVPAPNQLGQLFDPCELANDCERGLMCSPSASAIECDADVQACCLPFCDLTDAGASCPGVGQSCVSFYGENMGPEKYAKVGVCVIPD
jgi:hypothetical protein